MNNKRKNESQTDFPCYGLYLLDYLHMSEFEQTDDTTSVWERADRAAGTYEKARLEDYPADDAQELTMDMLLRGLRYSRYAIPYEVVENKSSDGVPEERREALIQGLLLLVGNMSLVYSLSDDNLALFPSYGLLYTEMTGVTVLYIREYGV